MAAARLALPRELFYKTLSEQSGFEVGDDGDLMSLLTKLAAVKAEYDKVAGALHDVRETGYGIVVPGIDELKLEEPEIMKQGGRYGVRLKASAPSIHMIRADIETAVSPIVGNEKQSEDMVNYLLQEFEGDTSKIWQSNIFGRSFHELVNEDLQAKLKRMPEDARRKLQETLTRIINEGSGDSSASFCDADIIERAPDSSGALYFIPACPGGSWEKADSPGIRETDHHKGNQKTPNSARIGDSCSDVPKASLKKKFPPMPSPLHPGIAGAEPPDIFPPLGQGQPMIFVAGLVVGGNEHVVLPPAYRANVSHRLLRRDREGDLPTAGTGIAPGPILSCRNRRLRRPIAVERLGRVKHLFRVCAMETTCVSQRRATSGDIQPGHVHALQLQQELLVGHASGVACQTSVAAHNPVTGDQNGDGVVAHGAAHCLGRGRNPLAPERPGQGAVCGDRAVGDLQQQAPHRLAEGAALGGQRRQSRKGSLGKIGVQPGGGLFKYRQVIFLYSI